MLTGWRPPSGGGATGGSGGAWDGTWMGRKVLGSTVTVSASEGTGGGAGAGCAGVSSPGSIFV